MKNIPTERVKHEFAKRMQLLMGLVLSMGVFFFVTEALRDKLSAVGISPMTPKIVFMGLAFFSSLWFWRCPACNSYLWKINLMKPVCHKCKAKLM